MKDVFFKFQFVVGLLLLACLNVQADDDLITKQIIVKLDEAGTLSSKIGDSKKYKITNIKIVGEINSWDISFLQDMAGYSGRANTEGNLSIIDLSDVKIAETRYNNGHYQAENVLKGGAFAKCTSLTRISLPATVVSIDDDAFYGCSNLSDITLPSAVSSIGDEAFALCTSLTNITLPSGVTSIGQYTFYGCTSLTNITLPSDVTSIGQYAFWGCTSLANITLPSGVTSIGQYAFYGCTSLANITLPSGVTSIEQYAFYGCTSLANITLPSDVTSIGQCAFGGCSSLTNLTIPSSVTLIADFAFADCKGLQSICVSWETPLVISASSFKNVDTQTCCLYVPKGTYDEYWLTDWGIFDNIIEYDVTSIDKVTTSGDAKEVSRYSVDGQRLEVPTKGLNIVKYSNGSVKKVMVQ